MQYSYTVYGLTEKIIAKFIFDWCSVLYEVFPMSFLMEQAGGQAFTGKQRVILPKTVFKFCHMVFFLFWLMELALTATALHTDEVVHQKFVSCFCSLITLRESEIDIDVYVYVCEQALDLVPTKLHERSPIFLGSYEDVEEIKALYAADQKLE